MPTPAQFAEQALQLAAAGRAGDAERLLRGVLAHHPADPDANRALGLLYLGHHRHAEAAAYLARAAEAAPTRADLWYDLGMAHAAAGRFAQAAPALARSLTLAPNHPQTLDLLGQVHLRLQQPAQALAVARRGLQAKPDDPGMLHTRMMAEKGLGMVEEAADTAERLASLLPDDPEALFLAAWQAPYSVRGDPARVRGWLERRGRLLPAGGPIASDRDPDRPLRIGFLCQDIRKDSPIARFVAAPLLHLDRGRFEIRGYLTEPVAAHLTRRLREAVAGGWADVSGLDDEALLARLRADRLDIVIETAGSTAGHRQAALARRAAPIQITCIGDPRTTGNPAIDRRLVDGLTDPAPAADAYCTERLERLPGCFLCYEPHEDSPPPRRPLDVEGSFVTFGSFNVADKTGPAVLDLWARILLGAPGSRLILKSLSYRPPEARERILARFKAAGVDPGRVSLVSEEQRMADHLGWYRQVDIALDTFPYAGTTTTCDALWMGVPVVTLRGAWHPARVGASLLTAVGLPELIADDPDHYVRLAHALAEDRERLAGLQAGLRARLAASPLLDARGYAARLGAALEGMWREFCAGG